ncbi:MAG: flagellar biosynthesis protein FlhA [Bryobacteraceae bacterium]|nr:flagellar biosynthesis protein FlhA [Bryobacteraceae bacterium]
MAAVPATAPAPVKAAIPAGLKSFARADLAVPITVLGIVLAMIVPLPSLAIDLLISANITVSVVVMLVAMYITKPVEFSVFPTTLLLMTLFRLALNISSSRLILLNGNSGTAAAGHVIEAFGNFVVGGNFIIGLVIFLVLIAIQYVVINHGAVRISEVTARFTLDAMPGKQMSIDSDLNAGLIDEGEARTRRRQLAAEAEFYGAMDGASRFTQRDAVASILITAINIVAGILIGVLQHDMDIARAVKTYTILTIGDGLVTVIPALMISISGGLIVTRAGADTQLASEFRRQLFGSAQPIYLAAGVLVLIAAVPGLPKIPFLVLSGGLVLIARAVDRSNTESAAAPDPAPAAAASANRDSVESALKVEPLAVEVGLGLVKLVEGGINSPLLKRVSGIRRQLAGELGYVLPAVRVTDNLGLKAREYSILLKGVEIARYELPAGCDLAIVPAGPGAARIEGMPAKEPAFGLDALWIPSSSADAARDAGYTVVDAVSVLATHFGELVRRHLHELFNRQDAKKALDRVAEENPRVVEDLVPKLLPLSTVQKVLQNLLRERVSIRDASTILEALGEAAQISRNPVLLTEFARQSIRRSIVRPYLDGQNLRAWFLNPKTEQELEAAVEHGEHSSHLNLAPQRVRELVDRLTSVAGPADTPTVIVTGSQARPFVRLMAEGSIPGLVALSPNELPPGVKLISNGTAG